VAETRYDWGVIVTAPEPDIIARPACPGHPPVAPTIWHRFRQLGATSPASKPDGGSFV